MSTLSKDELIERLKLALKEQGFKKTKATWRKWTDDFVFVLNVQGSQWSPEDYYINVGIYMKALGADQNPTEYRCHISDRIDHHGKTFDAVCKEALDWFDRHGDIQKLRILKQQNKLPFMTMVKVKEYLDQI